MPRPNREILTGGKRYKEKKQKNRVQEVVFDKEKRTDYLTGFHKRKLERKKKAQAYLEEQAKKDRLEERARIREERKLQVQKKLAEMKEAMELNPFLDKALDSSAEEESEGDDDDNEEEEEDDENDKSDGSKQEGDEAKEGVKFDDEWSGFENNADKNTDKKSKKNKGGILKKQIFEINDEDAPVTGTSEVVIESLENPNKMDLSIVTEKMNVDLTKADEVLNGSIVRAKKYARLMGMADTSSAETEGQKVSKPKKKKFRYLSKTERKTKNMKEKAKSMKRKNKDRD